MQQRNVSISACYQPRRRLNQTRRGSTLLIVLTLMGLLALMGVLFFTFAAQEQATAVTFSESARVMTAPSLEPDALIDFALEQLILGPDDTKIHSALWGGRHSLIPNLLGRDGVPFNGEGVNLRMNELGDPRVDQDFNYDVATDANSDNPEFLRINDSPSASGGSAFNGQSVTLLPSPDVDYTYPGINHLFLGFQTTTPHLNDSNGKPVPVIVPSFHRPALFRSGGIMNGSWFEDTAVGNRSLRPNPGHRFVKNDGTNVAARFASNQAQADAVGLRAPFPFRAPDINRNGVEGEQGVWSMWQWQSSIAIPIGTWTRPTTPTGFYFVATAAGTTGGTEPTWTTVAGSTVTDGGVTWRCATAPTYEYDIDLDGDGIRESVLLDLDFAPQRRGDGKLVVPMFAMHIVDADGLINLNSAGHVGENPFPADITMEQFGKNSYFSKSNSGITAAEVNPLVALYADPTATSLDGISRNWFDTHRRFLQSLGTAAGTNPRSTRELANLEGFFLLTGSPEFATSVTASADAIYSITTGRYGEKAQFLTAMRTLLGGGGWTFPAPGSGPGSSVGNEDDNANNFSKFPVYGWPVDYQGVGNVHNLTAGVGKQLRMGTNQTAGLNSIGPNRWPRFNQYHSHSTPDVAWQTSTYGSTLMENEFNQLVNESLESLSEITNPDIVEFLKNTATPQLRTAFLEDSLFGPADLAFLHLSPADSSRLAVGSRLAKLAPANFVGSLRNWDIRRQFTTHSHDRREFSLWTPNSTTATARRNTRSWEANILGSSNIFRPLVWWMLNDTTDPADPVRLQRWRLSAHQILVDQDGYPINAVNPLTQLRFRDLTPHPTSLGSTALGTSYTYASSGMSAAQQEYWARLDRQCLARDIYTFLYLYGGHTDGDSTSNPLIDGAFHSAQTKRQMAQFAVNVVDALDTDDVLTRFEFDTDLSNGWGLDDNPYTTMDADRAEVWGVERQQLTINEFLAVHAPINDQPSMTATPATATEWEDTRDNYFTFIELLNASPTNVTPNSNWQVKIWPRGSDPNQSTHRDAARQLILRSGVGTLAAGSRFVIASEADDAPSSMSSQPDSVFRLDRSNGTTFEDLIPLGGTADIDLDLVDTTHSGRFYVLDGNNVDQTASIGLINSSNADPASTSSTDPALPLVVSVRRRANLQRTAPNLPIIDADQEADNPWVEVDRIQIGGGGGLFAAGMQRLRRSQTSDQMAWPQLVRDLQSAYSRDPYDAEAPRQTPNLNDLQHSIGLANRQNATILDPEGTTTQFHFDRPYQSLAELMEIPTVGHRTDAPAGTTVHPLREAITYAKLSGNQQADLSTGNVTLTLGGKISASPSEDLNQNSMLDAGEDFDGNGNLDGTSPNRWYRLLNFLELPGGTNRFSELDTQASTEFGVPRNFGWPEETGKINLNTIRHHTVLGAILDDATALTVTAPVNSQVAFLESRDTSDGNVPDIFQDPLGGITVRRDWWKQFLQARDTFDGVNVDPASGLVLPGLGNSRPFRGWEFTARGGLSRDDTLLRRLPADYGQDDPRLLFELTTGSEHRETNSSAASDSYARFRLLQKLMNRTTTRSNTFLVYVGVQFHEAAEIVVGGERVIRIGGRLEDTPIHRGFVVIDRSDAIDQVKRLLAPTAIGGSGLDLDHTSNGILKPQNLPTPVDYYSYRALTSEETTPPDGIDWRSLIKFRQLLN